MEQTIVVYTPTHYESPGTQYRVDRLVESLKLFEKKCLLVIDERSKALRLAYRFVSPYLFMKEQTWIKVGERIANKVIKYKPDAAILIHDITAAASKFLESKGIKTIVSIENLTTVYHPKIKKDKHKVEIFNKLLHKYLCFATKVVTPSFTLTQEIKDTFGIDAETVPVGLKPIVTYMQALERQPPIKVAHTRWLKTEQDLDILIKYIRNNPDKLFLIHNVGISRRINEPNVVKYRFPDADSAASYVAQAHYSLIIESGDHYTLTAFYYHMALLQPMVMVISLRLEKEAKLLGLKITKDFPLDYISEVKSLKNIREKFVIPNVHRPIIKILE